MTEELGTAAGPAGRAIDLMRNRAFPDTWRFVPVAGKATFVKGWATRPLSQSELETAYKLGNTYDGLGVVTGEFSGGLIALDIDGPEADERYKVAAGDEYEPYGEETTMAWTSGKAGRRQILYRVPQAIVSELRDVKTLILRKDGTWACGSGDAERIRAAAERGEYQEVVIRFNQCQSVVPGSVHPDTGKRYQWLNYNGGSTQEVPRWLMDVLRDHRKPQRWLSEEDLAQIDLQVAGTAVPPRQIRGWFFREEVQDRLRPRLADLVFKHPTFDQYGWKIRDGANPQMMSGCPWHGGESGTAFQYSAVSGCWDCKACGVGGDVLDFVHKVAVNNPMASRPDGAELEKYVTEIATELGYRYPEDLQTQQIKELPRTVMSRQELLQKALEMRDSISNPGLLDGQLADLAQETGRRMSGRELLAQAIEYESFLLSEKHDSADWWDKTESLEFVIPGLLKKPSQILLHAAGGVGKTSACMGLIRAIGRGDGMKIRGIDVPVQPGPVLWIQSDQTQAKLKKDCEDNNIDPPTDKWFIYKRGFQINYTHKLREWIRQYKPSIVVVDSIGSCSTKMTVQEKDKEFATPLYMYQDMNGIEDGFPAVPIIWIHHNNKQGGARGTAYLENAVDERWEMRKPTDLEREKLRTRGYNPSSCRFIQIHKSRSDREGDLLLVVRDENYAYSLEDYTPTERREDDGNGDPEPHTMMLRIVKEHTLQLPEEGREALGMTVEEVWEQLVEEMTGQARKPCSQRTTRRWLERWVDEGLLVLGKARPAPEGEVRGKGGSRRPTKTYLLHTRARRGSPECHLCDFPSDPLQGKGSTSDNTSDKGGSDPCAVTCAEIPENEPIGSTLDTDATTDTAVTPVPECHLNNPVGAVDLGVQVTNASFSEIQGHPPLGEVPEGTATWNRGDLPELQDHALEIFDPMAFEAAFGTVITDTGEGGS